VAVAGGSSRGAGSRAAASLNIRGHRWVELCVHIAIGDKNDSQIKRAYGLSAEQLQEFVVDNADRIAEIAQAIEKAEGKNVAGLWITKKPSRLAELQSDVEDINSLIDGCRDEDGQLDPVSLLGLLDNKAYMNLVRMKRALLASVADEIDGPRRQIEVPTDERKIVSYLIDMGESGDSLK
jgi:hypothetical protein